MREIFYICQAFFVRVNLVSGPRIRAFSILIDFSRYTMRPFSYLTQSHPSYIEGLYRDFVANPDGIDLEYRKFFEGFDYAFRYAGARADAVEKESTLAGVGAAVGTQGVDVHKEFAVYQLIRAYVQQGYRLARVNPLSEPGQTSFALEDFSLTNEDLDRPFVVSQFAGLPAGTPLKQILAHLQAVYCGEVAIEFACVSDENQRLWITHQFVRCLQEEISEQEQAQVLQMISQAVLFEKFLHTKYVGQKRFSLEGCESLIVALDEILRLSAQKHTTDVVLGMAHRGRLNVLANVLAKPYEDIFCEFESRTRHGSSDEMGDVKYHLGYESTFSDGPNTVNVHLCANPSHLEAVNPVVLGFCRALQDRAGVQARDVLPILIHGDAAFAGQGIVYETVQMSRLPGYTTSGTVHIVVNNQIGFTTDVVDARSTEQATSLAAAVQAPVLRVNADSPEAVLRCVRFAVEYRAQFQADVFIDLIGYRRYGHNESDEPRFTQPLMYKKVDALPNVRDRYVQYLRDSGHTRVAERAATVERTFWAQLQERFDMMQAQEELYVPAPKRPEPWVSKRKSQPEDFLESPDTSLRQEELQRLFEGILRLPADFQAPRMVQKLLDNKQKLWREKAHIDWATGELLAYAATLAEGKPVRICGEDVKRGTFSHRHVCLFDENTNREYNRLSGVGGARASVYNSLLSEFGALGYEYGYSCWSADQLVVWEAQFGDFVNSAQVIVDQFLCSAEQKWGQSSNLVMLLPHGYEGQGPDHSSGRIERFLQSCAQYNWIITNITESANLFHALRRQVAWPFAKPLINFSPKANLRYAGSYSPVHKFTQGRFEEVIDCPYTQQQPPQTIDRVLLCSGKIYFELAQKQQQETRKDVAIVRLEQLYPLPEQQLRRLREKYVNAKWVWVQEEPHNIGAVGFLQLNWPDFTFDIISRNPSASTSAGLRSVHESEQQNLLQTAFDAFTAA